MTDNELKMQTLTHHTNDLLTHEVLEQLIAWGVEECCLAPGSRNASFVFALANETPFKTYYWPEERSAAFFALGRIKATKRPVAVITTSGTASAELLPAVIEAYYTGLPLVLITADRPSRFRGSGAPQSMEQLHLFGCYAPYMQDLEGGKELKLPPWDFSSPAHLNVCLEEPPKSHPEHIPFQRRQSTPSLALANPVHMLSCWCQFQRFWQQSRFPFIIVNGLEEDEQEFTVQLLCKLRAPVYLEAMSGIREDPRLAPFRITTIDKIWEDSTNSGYPIDAVLRLGSVPTARLWRDIEENPSRVAVCSISSVPFSGISWGSVLHIPLNAFCEFALHQNTPLASAFSAWLSLDQGKQDHLQMLYLDEPRAEPSLIHALSNLIPQHANIYLGNSLPIREWDLAATFHSRNYTISASRGMNGIDGQISTFLGLCEPKRSNWCIIGDLTAVYDLAAPWISKQMPHISANVVVVNNGGGHIFTPMYKHEAFLNQHQLNFAPIAEFWKWDYERWETIPESIQETKSFRLIEVTPCNQATQRFQQKRNK